MKVSRIIEKSMNKVLFVLSVLFVICTAACGEQESNIVSVEHVNTSSIDSKDKVSVSKENQGDSTYVVFYHLNDDSDESEINTTGVFGLRTYLKWVSDLGFSVQGKVFNGWRVYREVDDSWLMVTESGESIWLPSEKTNSNDEKLTYELKEDGGTLVNPTSSGALHLYAQWEDSDNCKHYSIEYHPDVGANDVSVKTTEGVYGNKTYLYTLNDLGFTRNDAVFEGWRVYRDQDEKWLVKNNKGNEEWMKLNSNDLPAGYQFALREDRATLLKPAEEGVVHVYAQWGNEKEHDTYTVEYYSSDDSKPIPLLTKGIYGNRTYLHTLEELGLNKSERVFTGWRIYRDVDDSWFVSDAEGVQTWQRLVNGELPKGYSYILRADGAWFEKPARSGKVQLYAQWE